MVLLIYQLSGNSNILILAIFVLPEFTHCITTVMILERQVSTDLTEEYLQYSEYMHLVEAPTYLIFSRKAKKNNGKLLGNFQIFNLFQTLGTTQELHGDNFYQLEKLVCFLFRVKVKNVNNARWKEFDQKLEENRSRLEADLGPLPFYKQVLLNCAK